MFTNKPPIGTRWFDMNEGDGESQECRSRQAAQQIKYASKEENILAATPPLEAQGPFFSMAVTEGIGYAAGEIRRRCEVEYYRR